MDDRDFEARRRELADAQKAWVDQVLSVEPPQLPTRLQGLARVIQLREGNPIVEQFHDEVLRLMMEDRFASLGTVEVVGALEYVKWNLINRS
ncbi:MULTISPECIES: hypothetical protein [Burkholderia cepacia complex]|uniref:Uncharacterized protein n=2 Tax=Burkholderia cepacia complex TaxID=87882 RepID=B9BQH0_9BURK|nr:MULTISPECIES: hypothetical protein [Burkholderia cepacia complex]EEE06865.1 conserved hypothetical protein [Burkholderia multivorans CGD2]EEE13191.1 conserved hypothetical protein [Burkholderia multivorans CGD2M]MBU9405983.1 hypothetical protein [Burkholderia multivorans]MBU9502917.1 hypothetical protein [Burkholderia multivorans]MBY4752033.1 hypothetical protein [Burkholderia dolosa]